MKVDIVGAVLAAVAIASVPATAHAGCDEAKLVLLDKALGQWKVDHAPLVAGGLVADCARPPLLDRALKKLLMGNGIGEAGDWESLLKLLRGSRSVRCWRRGHRAL